MVQANLNGLAGGVGSRTVWQRVGEVELLRVSIAIIGAVVVSLHGEYSGRARVIEITDREQMGEKGIDDKKMRDA